MENASRVGTIMLSVADVPKSNIAWAVGYRLSGKTGAQEAVAEQWNGSAWKLVDTPAFEGRTVLRTVIAPTPRTAYIVGFNPRGQTKQLPVAERWTGTRWQSLSPPRKGEIESALLGIVRLRDGALLAVGHYQQATDKLYRPLAETYQNGKWTMATPPAPAGSRILVAISAVPGTNTAWAVGQTAEGTGTLVDYWNGRRWKHVRAPNPGKTENFLSSVVAVSATDVWAVGGQFSRTSKPHVKPLIEHWNGTAWHVAPSPLSGPGLSTLLAITQAQDGTLWAVGDRQFGRRSYTLTEHRTATGWVVVPSPDPGSVDTLFGVADGRAGLWAVGSAQHGLRTIDPLSERYR